MFSRNVLSLTMFARNINLDFGKTILVCIWSYTPFNFGSIPLLFNICLVDLFFIINNMDIASCADDNTSYIAADNIDDLINSLEEASTILF